MNRTIEKHNQESIVSSLSTDSMIKIPDSPRSVMMYDLDHFRVNKHPVISASPVIEVRKCQKNQSLCGTSIDVVVVVSPNNRRIFFDTYWKKVGGTNDMFNRYHHQVQECDVDTDTSTSCSLDAEMSKVNSPMTTCCTESIPSLPSLDNDPDKRSSYQQRQRRQIFSSASSSSTSGGKTNPVVENDSCDYADNTCSDDDEKCTMKESLASDLSSMGVDIAPYYRRQVTKKTNTSRTTNNNKKGVSLPISCGTGTGTGTSTPKPSPMIHCVSDSVIVLDIQNQRRLLQQQSNIVLKSSTLQPLQSCLRKSRYSSSGTTTGSGHSRSQSAVVVSYSSTNTNTNTNSTSPNEGSSLLSDESNRSQCSTTSCNSESSSSSCLSVVTFDNKVTVVQYEIPTDAYCEGGWSNYFAR